jgi:hypothetical protein
MSSMCTGKASAVNVTSVGDGLLQCSFSPEIEGPWAVDLTYGNQAVTHRLAVNAKELIGVFLHILMAYVVN